MNVLQNEIDPREFSEEGILKIRHVWISSVFNTSCMKYALNHYLKAGGLKPPEPPAKSGAAPQSFFDILPCSTAKNRQG